MKVEDPARLDQEEKAEEKRLAIMMMKKKEKYLYDKIMFGKKRKVREVGSNVFLFFFFFFSHRSSNGLSKIRSGLVCQAQFKHSLTSYLKLRMFNSIVWSTFRPSVDLHSLLPSEKAQPHLFVVHRLTSWLLRGKPTTTLKSRARKRRRPVIDRVGDLFMRLTH